MRSTIYCCAAVFAALFANTSATATTIPVVEDVMTSAFFSGPDFVRGYDADDRAVHRVGSDSAFGLGPETVYLTFDPSDIAALGGPVPQAILNVESVNGGFGGDATPSNPFAMSAHAVGPDPLTEITDNTNPAGPTAWDDYFANNILPASATATTTVTGFGTLQFDITQILNDWIAGTNTVYAIALTGKHDTLSDGNILHGIANNSETAGLSHFISVVPEPSSFALLSLLGVAALAIRRV